MGVVPSQVKGIIPSVPSTGTVKSNLVRGLKAAAKYTIASAVVVALRGALDPKLPPMAKTILDIVEPVIKTTATGEPILIGVGGLQAGDKLLAEIGNLTGISKVVKPAATTSVFSGDKF